MPESRYEPDLLTTAIGGIQWAFVAMLIYSAFAGLYIEYVLATRTFEQGVTSIGPGRLPFYLCIAGGVVAGSLWVHRRTESRAQAVRETRRRVEFLVVLHLLPLLIFVWVFLPTAPIENTLAYRFAAPGLSPLLAIMLASYLVYWRGVDWVTNWRDYPQRGE
jgi:hypothetical protein